MLEDSDADINTPNITQPFPCVQEKIQKVLLSFGFWLLIRFPRWPSQALLVGVVSLVGKHLFLGAPATLAFLPPYLFPLLLAFRGLASNLRLQPLHQHASGQKSVQRLATAFLTAYLSATRCVF